MATTTKRRGRGEDSIYYDTANKCWCGSVSLGTAANGRRRRPKVTGENKKEVQDKLKALRAEVDSGVTSQAKHTVGKALERWMESPGVKKLAPKTKAKFRTLIDNQITPFIGAAKLQAFTADDVDDWLTERARFVTTPTLREMLSILRRAIRLAQRGNLVGRNVAELVDLPQGRPSRVYRSLTQQQAIALVAFAITSPLYAYIIVSLMTGVRTEEARELKWDRVHLDATPPHIEVWRSDRVGKDTKTAKSRRTLELPPMAVDVLRRHWEAQQQQRATSPIWHSTGYVFTTIIGTQLDASNVRREFRKALVTAGVAGQLGNELRQLREQTRLRPIDVAHKLGWSRSKLNGIESGRTQVPELDVRTLAELYGADAPAIAALEQTWTADNWTPRELRHSFVSLLSEAGVADEDIADFVGHSDTRTTRTIYRHELRPVITKGAAEINAVFAEAADRVAPSA